MNNRTTQTLSVLIQWPIDHFLYILMIFWTILKASKILSCQNNRSMSVNHIGFARNCIYVFLQNNIQNIPLISKVYDIIWYQQKILIM